MGGKTKQKTEPQPGSEFAQGLLALYLAPGLAVQALPENPVIQAISSPPQVQTVPVAAPPPVPSGQSVSPFGPGLSALLPSPTPSQPPPTFGTDLAFGGGPISPGSIPGTILPDFNALVQTAGQRFFSSISPDSPFATALNQVLNPQSSISVPQISAPRVSTPGQIIPSSATQQALNLLLNPPSVFDVMSGGPIVEEIQARTQAAQQALSERAMRDLERAIDIATSDLSAEGFLSGSQILKERARITDDVLTDLNVIFSNMGLENTRYLGNLAMQDLLLKTNSARAVLEEALREKGIDAQTAVALAKIASDQAIAQAQLQLQAQTAQQQAALGLLQLGQRDFQTAVQNLLGVQTLPFNIAGQLLGLPQVTTMSSKGAL